MMMQWWQTKAEIYRANQSSYIFSCQTRISLVTKFGGNTEDIIILKHPDTENIIRKHRDTEDIVILKHHDTEDIIILKHHNAEDIILKHHDTEDIILKHLDTEDITILKHHDTEDIINVSCCGHLPLECLLTVGEVEKPFL
ncbi:hypothetical protein CEXT_363901 [Caerostris extrusa]|uniref:Uncharacterized protein n=1 Tax=Caerostris extrusa TaxID=172846 RepID=A0AAV4NW34_CAEEX|nr:hypothetical protein CEXT_363901 [Caerostris extrusa]